MSSSAYGNASIKSSGLSSRLLSFQKSLALALDKLRLVNPLPKIAAALPDRLNPSVVHNLQIIEGIETSVIAQLDFQSKIVHSSDLINYLRMEYLNISYNIHLVNRLEHWNDAVDLQILGIVITARMSVANDSASPYHSLHTLSKSSLM